MKTNELSNKSIIVNANIHESFKTLCKGKNMKIGAAVEDLIKLYLHNPKRVQHLIDEIKEKQVNYV